MNSYQIKKIKQAESNLKQCAWNNIKNFFKDDSRVFREAFWQQCGVEHIFFLSYFNQKCNEVEIKAFAYRDNDFEVKSIIEP